MTTVSAGQSSGGLDVSSGETLTVLDGGIVTNTGVIDGGVLIDEGLASATSVFFATVSVTSGGIASATSLNSEGNVFVSSGAETVDDTLSGLTTFIIGQVDSVSEASVEFVGSATALGTKVGSGGELLLDVGAVSIDAQISGPSISSGGTSYPTAVELVRFGGSAEATSVGSGGSLVDLGSTSSAAILSGGLETVGENGLAYQTSIFDSGIQIVDSLGLASGTVLHGVTTISGGFSQATADLCLDGGASISAQVGSGGSILVSSGGIASASVISGGATITSGTSYFAAAYEEVYSGGEAIDEHLENGGSMDVRSGGMSLRTTISGVTASNATGTNHTAYENVDNGAIATSTTVGSGAAFSVFSGGTGVNTVIDGGGQAIVHATATTTGTVVGGTIAVSDSVMSVISGAEIISGGIAYGTHVEAMGKQVVASGGVGSDTTVDSGGIISISSGSTESFLTLSAGADVFLRYLAYMSGGIAMLDGNDILTVTEGAESATIQLAGNYAGETFATAVDPTGSDTLVTLAATPCYCAGTRIRTDRGERPVEDLSIGDMVVSALGGLRPIKWIGLRCYAGRSLAGRQHLLPVRIRKGALGHDLPRRDLRVSPLHAMLLDGVLVPAGQIANGTSIVQETDCRRVEYIHIELETHDAILAEGAASETFLDDDSRFMFQNAGDHSALYPGDAPGLLNFCAPRVENGYQLEALRTRLAVIALNLQSA